jgi:hypothetical protein
MKVWPVTAFGAQLTLSESRLSDGFAPEAAVAHCQDAILI